MISGWVDKIHLLDCTLVLTNPALVLVDPPLGNIYFPIDKKDCDAFKVHLNLQPFKGPYEDFTEFPRFSDNWNVTNRPRGAMLQDLLHYWEGTVPKCFDQSNPSILSLAWYPLNIVAAEWVKYVEVMRHCVKKYEYQSNQMADLDRFNVDLPELQSWQRRIMASQAKIKPLILMLEPHDSQDLRLLQDFKSISSNIEIVGRRLENMLLVVTSLAQIMDARQSHAETADVHRLTILALLFVPLSYVSSLFSMNSDNLPGSRHFWVYLAVALPVTLLVFLVALAPTGRVRHVFARLFQQRPPNSRLAWESALLNRA